MDRSTVFELDGIHRVHDAEKRVERRLNGITTIDDRVAVENLLENFGSADKTFTIVDRALQQPLRITLMRMRRSHQVHRDVGVDQDHGPSTT